MLKLENALPLFFMAKSWENSWNSLSGLLLLFFCSFACFLASFASLFFYFSYASFSWATSEASDLWLASKPDTESLLIWILFWLLLLLLEVRGYSLKDPFLTMSMLRGTFRFCWDLRWDYKFSALLSSLWDFSDIDASTCSRSIKFWIRGASVGWSPLFLLFLRARFRSLSGSRDESFFFFSRDSSRFYLLLLRREDYCYSPLLLPVFCFRKDNSRGCSDWWMPAGISVCNCPALASCVFRLLLFRRCL